MSPGGSFFDESDFVYEFYIHNAGSGYNKEYWLGFGNIIGSLNIRDTFKVNEDVFKELLRETNGEENGVSIIYNTKENAQQMIKLLEPYLIAKKLLGEL